MESFKTHSGYVLPLPIKDVDTDMIIPAQYLTSISREGFGENLFRRLKDTDNNFPMNNPKFKEASIIVARSNFGCGSSREHAVWAIHSAGFKVVIAPSFADIFFGNSAKNGLLLVEFPEDVVEKILLEAEANSCGQLTINLEKQTVTLSNGEAIKFEYDPFRKHCLLKGLDDFDYLLNNKQEIDSYWEKAKERKFFSTNN